MSVRFDDFEVDRERYELRRDGNTIALEPLVFDLLLYFVDHPDRVLSRDQLIEGVWKGRIVSDATVAGAVKSLRRALGDSGETQKYLQTLRGRGFRFQAEIRGDTASATGGEPARLVVREPALAILPVTLADGIESWRDLAIDLVEDLERILTRIPLLRISSRTRLDEVPAPSARQVHDASGAHFLLEISLRRRGDQLRANARLADARAGLQLWSEQIALPSDDPGLQDTLVRAVIERIEPQLNRAIYQLVRDSDLERNSRQLFLEASGLLALKGWHETSFLEAAALLRESVALEPEFTHAWAYLALILAFGHRVGLMTDRERTAEEASRAAERALELESMDSTVLGFAGCALCDLGMLSRGKPILHNAIERNPANGQAWVALGAALLLERDIAGAIEHLQRGIDLSPLDSRLSVWNSILAVCLLLAGDLAGAASIVELACRRDHRLYLPRVVLAAIELRRENPAAAATALDDAFQVKPDLSRAEMAGIVGDRFASALCNLRGA